MKKKFIRGRESLAPYRWAAKFDETNQRDGRRVQMTLLWWKRPKVEHGEVFNLFNTRRQCRAWIEEAWGYLRTRPDLRAEPHGWRMPRPVRVSVTVTEVCRDPRR